MAVARAAYGRALLGKAIDRYEAIRALSFAARAGGSFRDKASVAYSPSAPRLSVSN